MTNVQDAQPGPRPRTNDRDFDTPVPAQLASVHKGVSYSQNQYTSDNLVVAATDSPSTHSTTVALDARNRLVSTYIHNTTDALDLITFSATGKKAYDSPSVTPGRSGQTSSSVAPKNATS
ncbi:hypothetical protein IL306_011081 [Fusarium sp. DS 682]|nr:hypothetical protein IL306_011081 [Fusarium sp. DS 682]